MKRIALVGSYPPRKCGIATFTHDLNKGIKQNGIETAIVAVNDGIQQITYPHEVEFEIDQNEVASYINAASFLNTNNFDAVIIQHEFGIYGGRDGSHIIQLLKRLQIPVITTFHTIIDEPSSNQRNTLIEITKLSHKIVSISQKGIEILQNHYQVSETKYRHIHHGVHKIKTDQIQETKQKLGIQAKHLLLTFGLLSKNKSIEVVINALPEVVRQYPDTVYIVLGATHPHVLKREGEEYRHSLIRLVRKLKLEKHVIFIDRFVSNTELFKYLNACDIYIMSYLGEKQISSGTLIYTMSAGKPIISTPFWYAKEMLSNNRGLFFDFNNASQLSEKIIFLLSNKHQRDTIAKNALALAKKCYWPKIGKQYIDLVSSTVRQAVLSPTHHQLVAEHSPSFTLPPLNLHHLRVLTDSTGILQHSRFNIPDRSHGYCLDDNARALLLAVLLQNEVQDIDKLNRLTNIYLSFIDYAYNTSNGMFRNFLSYERKWLEEAGSQDSGGRIMWALGYTVSNTADSNFYYHSKHMFNRALEGCHHLSHPRAIAYLVLGFMYYLQTHRDTNVLKMLEQKTNQLYSYFDHTIDTEWIWHDGVVTYGNSRIPQALIQAGMQLNKPYLSERGLKILDWLIGKQFADSIFVPIGNKGWLTPQGKAMFDQQPLEAHGMIDACLQAEAYTNNEKYEEYALQAFAWFTGENILSEIIYDFATGGCRDGLHATGVNLNQGAESTLSWLISLIRISQYLRNKNK